MCKSAARSYKRGWEKITNFSVHPLWRAPDDIIQSRLSLAAAAAKSTLGMANIEREGGEKTFVYEVDDDEHEGREVGKREEEEGETMLSSFELQIAVCSTSAACSEREGVARVAS